MLAVVGNIIEQNQTLPVSFISYLHNFHQHLENHTAILRKINLIVVVINNLEPEVIQP